MNLEELAQDVAKVEDGAWIQMDEGYEVLMRSAASREVKKLEQRHMERNKRFYRKGKMVPLEIREKDQLELVVNAIVLDWKGIEAKGKTLKWSKDVGMEVLGNPAYRQMLDDIVMASNEIGLFASDDKEQEKENSKRS